MVLNKQAYCPLMLDLADIRTLPPKEEPQWFDAHGVTSHVCGNHMLEHRDKTLAAVLKAHCEHSIGDMSVPVKHTRCSWLRRCGNQSCVTQ